MEKKKDYSLNEKDSLTDILTGEKELVKLYGTAITEATNKEIRRIFKTNMSETADDQFMVFSEMMKNDYYQTKPADKATIDQKIESFSKISVELTKN